MAEAFDPRANVVGAQRLGLALLVVVSHSFPLGYGEATPLLNWSHKQTDLGLLAVTGFFVLSGFLIVRSARQSSLGRFAWHRFLRIFPGFWVCLLATAFVLAPVLYLVQEGTLAGFWGLDPSALRYVTLNFRTKMAQYGIGDLLSGNPSAGPDHQGVLDGALWSLRYELLCYVFVALLMVVGATRRRTGLVVAAFTALAGLVLLDWVSHDRFGQGEIHLSRVGWPFVGGIDLALIVPLAAVFFLGGVAASRPHHFVVDGRLAALAGVVVIVTMRYGGFDFFGLLAFAYAVLWMATLRTTRLRDIGVRQDWSYGVYIYAFPIQQALAAFGVQEGGHVIYLVTSIALALLAGFASWHLVEKRALGLKHLTWDWRQLLRRQGPATLAADGARSVHPPRHE